MARNCAPVKSIVPRSIARRMRSGMLVGPGFMKKCQPCAIFLASELIVCGRRAAQSGTIIAATGKTIDRTDVAASLAPRRHLHKKKAGHEALPANSCAFFLPELGIPAAQKPP